MADEIRANHFDYDQTRGRQTYEHKVVRIYAREGLVIVVYKIDGNEHALSITRREAIARARVINESISRMKYQSDIERARNLVESFIKTVNMARKQTGSMYASSRVSMAVVTMDDKSDVGFMRAPIIGQKTKETEPYDNYKNVSKVGSAEGGYLEA